MDDLLRTGGLTSQLPPEPSWHLMQALTHWLNTNYSLHWTNSGAARNEQNNSAALLSLRSRRPTARGAREAPLHLRAPPSRAATLLCPRLGRWQHNCTVPCLQNAQNYSIIGNSIQKSSFIKDPFVRI